jgi:hypothetical protein
MRENLGAAASSEFAAHGSLAEELCTVGREDPACNGMALNVDENLTNNCYSVYSFGRKSKYRCDCQ